MKDKKGTKKDLLRRDFIKTTAVGVGATAMAGLGARDASAQASAPVVENWDREADVVVIGTGHAGLSTAITAHDLGVRVIVLEKMPREFEGGNSRVSGNMWWTPTNVPEGIEYITALSYGLTDQESIRALAEELSKNNDWLRGLGVNPEGITAFRPEYPELPGSGSVQTWANNGVTGEGAVWIPVRKQVETRGIEVLHATPAKQLIQNAQGEIIGVRATAGQREITIKARRGVVLACGGFEYAFDMQAQHLPAWPVYGRGTPGNTGDGIKMAQKAGAALWHMNNALAGVGCIVVDDSKLGKVPVPVAFGGRDPHILVDALGTRFMNERRPNRHGFGHKEILFYFDTLGTRSFPRLPCYGIFDATRLGTPLVSTTRKFGWFNWYSGYAWSADNSAEVAKGWIVTGSTVADLATTLRMDPATLERSIARYNQSCDSGSDADFGRPAASLIKVEKPPYAAVALYPIMYNTQGGPRRNANCQIVDPNDRPIPRLYSAGELGSFWGWMYNGGGNNSECFATGRIAGRNAAAQAPWS